MLRMVKIIGLLFILSSILALAAGAYIDFRYSGITEATGNVISNVLSQPNVPMNTYDYLAGFTFSYSIASFIIGFIFLFRV